MIGRVVGFIGLGNMGYPMASNLFKASPHTSFWILDHSAAVTKAFQSEHGSKVHIAETPAELGSHCSIVMTMLPAAAHVRSVYLNKDGLLNGMKEGGMVIDSSTIDPNTSKNITRLLQDKGVIVLDAPVSGGTNGAKNGSLTFMVGSPSRRDFEDSKIILEKMGKNIVDCGGSGNGQIAKICNNLLLGTTMLAASETMNLGIKLGMDPKLLSTIINTSTGRCFSVDSYNPVPGILESAPSSRNYSGGFGVSLMAKDMGLALDAAKETGANVALGALALKTYQDVMSTDGYEKKDFSVVYKYIK